MLRIIQILLFFSFSFQIVIAQTETYERMFDDGELSDEEINGIRAFVYDSYGGRERVTMPKNEKDLPYDERSYFKIYDLEAALKLGFISFRDTMLGIPPELITDSKKLIADGVACTSCHVPALSFYSGRKFGIGIGGFGVGKDRIIDPKFPMSEIDSQKVTTPSSINVFYGEEMLWSGGFGATGNNAKYPMETLKKFHQINTEGKNGIFSQAIAGQFVHNVNAGECVEEETYVDLVWKAYRIRLSLDNCTFVIGNSLMLYQFSLITNNAPVQKFFQGDNSALDFDEYLGLIYMIKNGCNDCHTGPAMGNEFYSTKVTNETDFKGRYLLTGEVEDMNNVKAPTLYNVAKDKKSLGCEGEKKGFWYFKEHSKIHHFGKIKEELKIIWATLKTAFYDDTIKDR